ncbi:Carboxylesterase family-domain-containing protein [Mycena sp. CBHHK59/15]|nr:Carboxylesterase family-domain-containing protein [Mycena sp. CBHHK59/15]
MAPLLMESCPFKGVRFAEAPTGQLRWEPPVPFVSAENQNATVLGPSCLQQFRFVGSAFTQALFNNPPPASEDEDCLFSNVWTAAVNSTDSEKKPVFFWIYGGSFIFGTGSLPLYDGFSLASNQDVVVVTINYRTNVFGFTGSEDLPITQNNLGLLDQELALEWVQQNIAQFGGDPDKVTIVGESAGSGSVGLAIVCDRVHTPFRAGIMLSVTPVSMSGVSSFTSFDTFAAAVGCTQDPGSARLDCLKQVPGSTIRNFTNGPDSGTFGPIVKHVAVFTNPFERLRAASTAGVPLIIGNLEDDGTLFAVGIMNLTAFAAEIPGNPVTPEYVRSLYPGLNDSMVIASSLRDASFRCPVELWSAALTDSGVSNVFRYTYGAVFADLKKFPGAGAWHSSESMFRKIALSAIPDQRTAIQQSVCCSELLIDLPPPLQKSSGPAPSKR